MLDVSIIIVNWNTKELLQNCLTSIYEQAGDVSYETIVVDNGSTDGSVDIVKAEFPQVVLIANTENRGFAAANNQGIGITKGRYVLLLNSDTIVLDNAIFKTVEFANEHREAAVVGCRVLNPDGTMQTTCFMFPSILNMLLSASYLYKLFPKSRFFGRERMTWWDRSDTREVDVVTGCFMLVQREAIEQIGMLDERFFMYGEETDWCSRFKREGWKILFAPVAEIVHFGGVSATSMGSDMTLQLRGSILQFIAKHHSKGTYLLACMLTAIFFAFRVPYWLVRTIVSRKNRPCCWNMVKAYSKGSIRLLRGGDGLLLKAER